MSLVSEFLQKVGLIRNETQHHGNTKERVADTFETLFNLDVWFKKLDPQDPNANKIYQADGTLIDLPEGSVGELKKIGDGYGLQHQIDNPDNYGTLGNYAVNLSFSDVEGDYGATGIASHAEGSVTTASGAGSHAEGEGTIASGIVSHAEGGGTTASGDYSHAEGGYTTASGDYSHAEGGGATASGDASHAEGQSTTASGGASHAEGNSTTSGSFAENARGSFNEIITPISETSFNSNDVIESVGVGTSPSQRKNALTRWKNGAFKWLLQPLTNITNAVKGFHAADEEGRLNYHDGTEWSRYAVEGDYNGVTPTVTASVITNYEIDIATQTEHWNLTMTGDTDFGFTNMFASGNSKVITITLEGDYAFTFPSWLKSLETNDEYDTIEGSLVAEIVINIKNGGTSPSGYYSLQMIDYGI